MAAKQSPRSESVRVMLARDELTQLRAKAESLGLSLSAYLRQLGLRATRTDNQ